MNDTPRTDAGLEYDDTTVDDVKGFARQLERELNVAQERISRLEEAGDAMERLLPDGSICDKAANLWLKAKEAKP